MPQDYGDLATWIGSIGTVAAFAVAYYQIHQERRHRLAREFRDRLAVTALLVDLVIRDRKSTRLNSSHVSISYALFCSKKESNRRGRPPRARARRERDGG